MTIDSSIFFIAGIGLFAIVMTVFAVQREVNRFLIFLLALSMLLLAVAATQVGLEAFAAGEAGWPSGRRTTGRISRDAVPIAFWVSTIIYWAAAAGLWFSSAYLCRIAFMRRPA